MPSRITGHRTFRVASVLALALGAALALPAALSPQRGNPPAPATAGVKGPTKDPAAPVPRIWYRATPGQDNRVTVTESTGRHGGTITYVIDDVVPITPLAGCTHLSDTDHTKVSCVVEIEEMATSPYRTLFVELGDGEDTARGHRVGESTLGYTEFSFGSGNDTWVGSSNEVASVYGGPGDDTLTSTRGTMVFGNDGDDTITALNDATVVAGDGDDTVRAGDEVKVIGGHGDDVLQGGEGSQSLLGEVGDDTIHGGPGDDLLCGNDGNDVLYGDDGDDVIWGEDQNLSVGEKYGRKRDDKLYGGPGTDELQGGPGPDELYGGPGTDKLAGGASRNTLVQD